MIISSRQPGLAEKAVTFLYVPDIVLRNYYRCRNWLRASIVKENVKLNPNYFLILPLHLAL